MYIELLLAPKHNPKIDICRGLYKLDAIKILINMILPEATEYIAEVLIANVLYTVTGLVKSTNS